MTLQYLKGAYKKREAEFFHTVKIRWKRLSRKVVDSSSLDIFKTRLRLDVPMNNLI